MGALRQIKAEDNKWQKAGAEGQETEPPERWVDREKRNGTIG